MHFKKISFSEGGKNQYSMLEMGVLSLVHYSTSPPNPLAFVNLSELYSGECGLGDLEMFFRLALGIWGPFPPLPPNKHPVESASC